MPDVIESAETPDGWRHLPRSEFAFPGPLRDRLVDLVLSGAKTATTSLLADYRASEEPLPEAGMHSVLVDSAERPVALLETTEVRVVRLDDVDIDHVRDEGEGHTSVESWRADHERFWSSEQMLEALADVGFQVDDDTPVVLERFACLEVVRGAR